MTIIVSDNFSLIKSGTNHFLYLKFKSLTHVQSQEQEFLLKMVIYGYWLLSSDFCKTSWIFLHDPVCPKTGPILSKNLVRSVLKPGPFCPGTWSVLSLDVVRFVLKRGQFCLVRFVHGPFCPSTLVFDFISKGRN